MSYLKNRKDRFHYTGSLEEYQLKLQKESKYQPISYTSYQNYLYKRALYGLGALNNEELATICKKKKYRISKVYHRGQIAINLYKQQITNFNTNLLFKRLFPESPITQFFINNSETDEKFKNTLTFKDLNIDKDKIVAIFIEDGILPKNFYDLKRDPNQLPRLRGDGRKKESV